MNLKNNPPKPIYAELRDGAVARVYLADSVDGALSRVRDSNTALSKALESADRCFEDILKTGSISASNASAYRQAKKLAKEGTQ